ncbi:TetR/AcrR family transcriptional regulator [Kitasatospora sp. CB01950]|uniref:TetR/AcrR family transcriptional regulator n=1 Tax=Kitasatospora sp. CB01950 TaxID=1703930 RepID=UPI0009F844D8|nr:TetR/AcrR family transcriptional regulator [Kitasatospora sp. CB01950]
MSEQEQLAERSPGGAFGRSAVDVVPEQRGPGERERFAFPQGERPGEAGRGAGSRLRVDARRNLESVLRAAREVFGELGYGAPMEEVARRAGVGVGTVYRRFPSKEVLVQRIAAEEVSWLTAQARESLYGGLNGPWDALAGFLQRAAASGAGRLLPPEAFRYAEEIGRVPEQRAGELRAFAGASASDAEQSADPRLLLQLLAALVARAGAAGELRAGVTVSDVVLVLTAAVPVHASAAFAAEDGGAGGGAGGRLLQILLQGLRAS